MTQLSTALWLLLLSWFVAYSLGASMYWLLKWPAPYGFFAVCGLFMAIIECAHIVPVDQPRLRAITVFLCTDLLLRCVDVLRNQFSERQPIQWRDYWRFLIPFPVLLVVLREKQQRFSEPPSKRVEIARTILGGGLFVVTITTVLLTHRSELIRRYFLFDHAIKVSLFIALLESGAQLLLGLEHLCGFATRPFVDRFFLSKTPAEFWTRYNQRVQQWLYLNVFVPSGGKRRPARGVVVVFVVSAVLHELMFGIVTREFTGYQATFFLLQIPAVLASGPLERIAQRFGIGGDVTLRALTYLWFGLTSMFFFHAVEQIFPIMYVGRSWLP